LEDGSATKQWKYGCSQLNPSSSKTAIQCVCHMHKSGNLTL
jgi:hypothetical protein